MCFLHSIHSCLTPRRVDELSFLPEEKEFFEFPELPSLSDDDDNAGGGGRGEQWTGLDKAGSEVQSLQYS